MTHRKSRSTEATRRRRMDKARERARRAWVALHRAQLEFETAWEKMPEAERRAWLDAHDLDYSESERSGSVMFYDMGA